MVHLPPAAPLWLMLKPMLLYQLPAPPPALRTWLKQHWDWCLLHRGVQSLAAWHPMDLRPYHFYGAYLQRSGSGTVRPLEVDRPHGRIHFCIRWNARTGITAPPCFHYKEAVPRAVVDPATGCGHLRFYPAQRWQATTPMELHVGLTPGKRQVCCEGIL